jgi:hypothetical protein
MMADVPEPGSEHRVTASVARFCPLLLNDLRHPRVTAAKRVAAAWFSLP